MSDDETENMRFSVENDFEGGEWIDGEFYALGPKERAERTFSKEDAIYGIFGDDYAPRQQRQAKTMPLGAGVRFVSGGIVGGTTEDSKQSPEPAPTTALVEEEPETAESAAVNRFRRSAAQKRKSPSMSKENDEDEAPAAKQPTIKPPARSVMDADFGKFEKYSKGIGMKLLKKMGFTGRLGKNEEGVVNPIKATLRTTRACLDGSNSRSRESEAAQEATATQALKPSSSWRKSQAGPARVKKEWKTAAELMAEHQTAKEAPQTIVDMRTANVVVIPLDQIGAVDRERQKNLTPTGSAAAESLPELQYNMRLLVEMCEADIYRLDRAQKAAQDALIPLMRERDMLQTECTRDGKTLSNITSAMALIDKCQEDLDQKKKESNSETSLTARLKLIENTVKTIIKEFPDEYVDFGLSSFAISWSLPLFKSLMAWWQPRQDLERAAYARSQGHSIGPSPVMGLLLRWRSLFELPDSVAGRIKGDQTDVFEQITMEVLVPKLQQDMTACPIRSFEPLLALLESVKPILSAGAFAVLISQSVYPKLKREVDMWNPRVDPQPIQDWVCPWMNTLSEDMMQPIFASISFKLGNTLQSWHPNDVSAKNVIQPWQTIFRPADFTNLISRCVLPKLIMVLRSEFRVNPQQQDLQPFHWVMDWEPLMTHKMMAELLCAEFFPKWFNALGTWLQQTPPPDFAEVSKWYMGWKSLFDEGGVKEHPRVKAMWRGGLDLMNAALAEQPLAPILNAIQAEIARGAATGPTASELPYISSASSTVSASILAKRQAQLRAEQEAAAAQAARERALREQAERDMGLLEILEQMASNLNVVFMPNTKRPTQDGKPLYVFGKMTVMLDLGKKLLYTAAAGTKGEPSAWLPISLKQLAERAQE